MGAVLVGNYRIRVPKDITFKLDPGDEVAALKGTLFQKIGNVITPLKKWNSKQLTDGVKFTAEEGVDRYDIVVTAAVTADSTLQSTATFDPTPPQENKKTTKLLNKEGKIERLWLFLPIVQSAE
jgi:hypothetical protein